jgi:hypothetical protein
MIAYLRRLATGAQKKIEQDGCDHELKPMELAFHSPNASFLDNAL